MASGNKSAGAGSLLAGDVSLLFLLLNEVRHRIIGRLFGLSRRDSNLMTIFAIGSLTGILGAAAARLRRVRLRPSVTEAGIGAAVLKEGAHGIAGDWSRGTSFFSALILLVVLEKSFGPALRGSLRAVRGSLRGMAASWRRVRTVLEGD